MDQAELLRLKAALTPPILAIRGVSGLGVGDDCLNVYLEADDALVRSRVENAVRSTDPAVSIRFIVTGLFQADDRRDAPTT